MLAIAVPCKLGHAQAAQQNETKGVCSPIAPDNKGSITINCSGFSDKQYRVLRDFLSQLSSEQAQQQDILLSKINEVLDTLRKQQSESRPRAIPDSDLQIISYANWGELPVSNIVITAPIDDVEAENFAKQIAGVFERGGMNVGIVYKRLSRGPEDPDLKIVHNNLNYYCTRFLLTSTWFAQQISVKYERINPPPGMTDKTSIEKYESDPTVTLSIFVYPKKPI
jgi:hypothetical protein